MNAPIAWSNVLAQFLSTGGDGTGTVNAGTVDYTTPGTLYIEPPATQVYAIHSLVLHLGDVGALNQAAGFGAEATALTNGIRLRVQNAAATVLLDLLNGRTIAQNRHFESHGFELSGYTFGSAPQAKGFRLNLVSIIGAPLEIQNGERLAMHLTDSFVAYTELTLKAYGTKRTA